MTLIVKQELYFETKLSSLDRDNVAEFMLEVSKLQAQLEKAEKVIKEIKDFENNDHLDVVGCELQHIAREYFKDKEKNNE